MKIPFAVDGTWWLPKFPNKRVQGHLAFSIEQGTALELYDQFPDPLIEELRVAPRHPYTPELIVGTIEGRTDCTVVNNFCTDLSRRPRFASEYLLLGSQFQLVEDLRFKGLSFRVKHLEEWTGMTPLDPRDDKDPFLPRLRSFHSILDPQTHFETTFERPVCGQAAVASHFNPVFGITRFSSEHIAQVRVSFSTAVHLTELLQFVHDCRNFFTLVVGRDTPPFHLQLCSDDLQSLNGTTRHAELLYSGIGTQASEEIHPDEMLLPMSCLKDIGGVFSSWMNQASNLRQGASWFLGAARNRGYLETEFLTCTQAVEALHRLKNPRKVPLKQRLRDLIGDDTALVHVKNTSAFLDKVVETRNFLAHQNPAQASDAASGEELFNLTAGLRAIVTVCLLTSVGVPRDLALRRVVRQRWTY
ncbi:MAG: ApeA N-terminal domain 1-containing protein [Terriglobia bacterium]